MTETSDTHDTWFRVSSVLALLTMALVFVLLYWFERRTESQDRSSRHRQGELGPRVEVTRVTLSSDDRRVDFPGEVHGYHETTLYAKWSGYVVDLRFERGDRVRKGQLLAVLEAPDLEQQLAAARSSATTTRLNAERAQRLVGPGVVALSDRDVAVNAARVAEAEVKRLDALRAYQLVRAPFEGVITARYVDSGALVPAATGSTQSDLPVADLADVERVRILVYLSQDVATFVRSGDPVELLRGELQLRKQASITRCANALDPRTRTMVCEIESDNAEGAFQPGTFVRATIHLKVQPMPVIPAEALVIRNGETQVALVDHDHVHFQDVNIAVDEGRTLRIDQGLRGDETLAVNAPIELTEGDRVQATVRQERSPAISAGAADRNRATGGGPPPSRSDAGTTKDGG